MDVNQLRHFAQELLAGRLGGADFTEQVLRWSVVNTGDAAVDVDRLRRCGYPEVIYGPGKSPDSMARIAAGLLHNHQPVLATRVTAEQAEHLCLTFAGVNYNPVARTLRIEPPTRDPQTGGRRFEAGYVLVLTAGTGDLPVAEEARETLAWMGARHDLIPDVGVAGPHRLQGHLQRLRQADAIVVAAGMEGALPSIVGGHVACPVIGVPTSVGYGVNFGGVAALFSMLNSCAANVAVVNIDAGFKAGFLAGLIAARSTVPEGADRV